MEIAFFKVGSDEEKRESLLFLIEAFFLAGRRQQLILPHSAAVDYIDQWLWNEPRASFLPHGVASRLTPLQQQREPLLLSERPSVNLNGAQLLFNLHEEPWQLDKEQEPLPHLLIELLDGTAPERQKRAEHHLSYYQERGKVPKQYIWSHWRLAGSIDQLF